MNGWNKPRDPVNAFATDYTTLSNFYHKFNFILNELLITRKQLFLHDYILSEFCIDIAVMEKKYQVYEKSSWNSRKYLVYKK